MKSLMAGLDRVMDGVQKIFDSPVLDWTVIALVFACAVFKFVPSRGPRDNERYGILTISRFTVGIGFLILSFRLLYLMVIKGDLPFPPITAGTYILICVGNLGIDYGRTSRKLYERSVS